MKLWFELADGQRVLKECRLDRVLGRQCVGRAPFKNQSFRSPKGTRFVIVGYEPRAGWALKLPAPCSCCGLTGHVHGVSWQDVLIDGPVPVPPSKAALEAAFLTGGEVARAEMERAWERGHRNWHGVVDDTDD